MRGIPFPPVVLQLPRIAPINPPAASGNGRVNNGRADTRTYTRKTCRCRVRRIFVNQATSVAVPAAMLSAVPITKLLLLYAIHGGRTDGSERESQIQREWEEGWKGKREKERYIETERERSVGALVRHTGHVPLYQDEPCMSVHDVMLLRILPPRLSSVIPVATMAEYRDDRLRYLRVLRLYLGSEMSFRSEIGSLIKPGPDINWIWPRLTFCQTGNKKK